MPPVYIVVLQQLLVYRNAMKEAEMLFLEAAARRR